jgi:hypothetical protein
MQTTPPLVTCFDCVPDGNTGQCGTSGWEKGRREENGARTARIDAALDAPRRMPGRRPKTPRTTANKVVQLSTDTSVSTFSLTVLTSASRPPARVVTGRARRGPSLSENTGVATSRRDAEIHHPAQSTYLAHPGTREPAVARARGLGRDAELRDAGHREGGKIGGSCSRRAEV